MERLKEIKVGSALGIAVISLFAVIYFALSYRVVDDELQRFGEDYYRLYVIK